MSRFNVVYPIAVASALLAGGSSAAAGEKKVPEEFGTIQAAVDAAASGDVVVCGPGTYAEAVVA